MSKRQTRITKNQQAATETRDRIVAIIGARKQALIDAQQPVAIEWDRIVKNVSQPGFVNALAALHGFVSFDTLCDILPNHDKRAVVATRYVQAKTVEKVVNLTYALAGGTTDKMSAYTLQVVAGLLANAGALTITGAQATLSRRIAKPDDVTLNSRANYTTGTAGAQASQVRDLLRVLGLAEVNKGKRDDRATLTPQAIEKLGALFAEDPDLTEAVSEALGEGA